MQHFSPSQLQQYLADTDEAPLLLDVREPWEFERCHIEGSVLVPMRELAARLPELDPQRETVVICHHGVRSRHVGGRIGQDQRWDQRLCYERRAAGRPHIEGIVTGPYGCRAKRDFGSADALALYIGRGYCLCGSHGR